MVSTAIFEWKKKGWISNIYLYQAQLLFQLSPSCPKSFSMDMTGFVRAALHVQINLCMHNSHLSDVASLGFFWYSKGGNHTAEKTIHYCRVYVVCNMFQPAFQLKKENNVLGSGSLYLMAALQFSNTNTLVPLQCKSSTSVFQDKKAQRLSSLLHTDYYTVSTHATTQWLKKPPT